MTALSHPIESQDAVPRLQAVQTALCDRVRDLDEQGFRGRFHNALSPLGWHLRHCAYIESFWLREIAARDDRLTAPLRDQCVPELAPKDLRGAQLPPREELLDWAEQTMSDNRKRLADFLSGRHEPVAYESGFLAAFLICHHAQHLETMAMASVSSALQDLDSRYQVNDVLAPAAVDTESVIIDAADHVIGAEAGFAYDNERPARQVRLAGFSIARRPVSNAAWLSFMADDGYRRADLWSAAGWAWRTATNAAHPYQWRRDHSGHWYEVASIAGVAGPRDLDPAAAVHGVSRHEAGAFARWTGARLPHELHWEAAERLGRLDGTEQVWEWCANAFHPYPGFAWHPYREYSAPWYDTRHFVLRGSSRHTWPENRRPSFRNYYTADCRHIFSGLRLTFD